MVALSAQRLRSKFHLREVLGSPETNGISLHRTSWEEVSPGVGRASGVGHAFPLMLPSLLMVSVPWALLTPTSSLLSEERYLIGSITVEGAVPDLASLLEVYLAADISHILQGQLYW